MMNLISTSADSDQIAESMNDRAVDSEREDPHRAMKGILTGVLLGVVIWAAIGLVILAV